MAANANNNNNRNNTSEHVEFSVKAEEDLFLEGSEKTIKRVTAETNYSCLMLKSQRFSSLFRHYAKYHGLRKEELEYYFVNTLGTEDTPEDVHLQRGDTITVRKKRDPEAKAKKFVDSKEFFLDMRDLLQDKEHMDCEFVVARNPWKMRGLEICIKTEDGMSDDESSSEVTVRAHKAMLIARSPYFRALFDRNSFREGKDCSVSVDPEFNESHVRTVLEYIYTNKFTYPRKTSFTDDLLAILKLSDRWLLQGLKNKVESQLVHFINLQNVPKLYLVAGTEKLRHACIQFIKLNLTKIVDNEEMKSILTQHPDLCVPILQATAEMVEVPHLTPPSKKQRTRSPMDAPSSSLV